MLAKGSFTCNGIYKEKGQLISEEELGKMEDQLGFLKAEKLIGEVETMSNEEAQELVDSGEAETPVEAEVKESKSARKKREKAERNVSQR